MLARIRGRISPGATVLMHHGVGPGATRKGCAATVDLVRPLVALMRSQGPERATLGELRHPLPDRNPDFQSESPRPGTYCLIPLCGLGKAKTRSCTGNGFSRVRVYPKLYCCRIAASAAKHTLISESLTDHPLPI
jgi:hypothetical protein